MNETNHQVRAVVFGGTGGFGGAAVSALRGAGAEAWAVSRSAPLATSGFRRADVANPGEMRRILDELRPNVVVFAVGAHPLMRPLGDTSWDAFNLHWNAEVRATFDLLQDAVNGRLVDGACVIVFSSGAALSGSPLSGGYASSKQAQRFLCRYAAAEVRAANVPVRVHCLLPNLTPHTALGRGAIAGYAREAGVSQDEFSTRLPSGCTPAIAGEAVLMLARGEGPLCDQVDLRLDGVGLHAMHE